MPDDAPNLRILLFEPYYGGSHAAFVDTLVKHSRHRITVATLPARKWKWRMRGAAIWFARQSGDWLTEYRRDPFDLILANDMLAVADLRALLPADLGCLPVVCYFHENQLTYPLSDDDQRDYQYGMTNITSCLAADEIWFNSRFHRDVFLTAAADLLNGMPDHIPPGIIDDIHAKSSIVYPPVDVRPGEYEPPSQSGPLRIAWPHRWEYDKNPEPLFSALLHLADAGHDFRLVLLGEQFRTAPPIFRQMLRRLDGHIDHAGYIEDRNEYLRRVATCHLVVSTAIQENFGIAVLEAILAGCRPLLPNRLAYPELIPEEFHEACLYETDDQLPDRLARYIDPAHTLPADDHTRLRRAIAEKGAVANAIPLLDSALTRAAHRNR